MARRKRPIAGSSVSSIERGQAAPNINEDVGQTMTTISRTSISEEMQSDLATVETAGWFEDPEGRHALRYFDGGTWTDHVTHFGPTPCIACRVNAR